MRHPLSLHLSRSGSTNEHFWNLVTRSFLRGDGGIWSVARLCCFVLIQSLLFLSMLALCCLIAPSKRTSLQFSIFCSLIRYWRRRFLIQSTKSKLELLQMLLTKLSNVSEHQG